MRRVKPALTAIALGLTLLGSNRAARGADEPAEKPRLVILVGEDEYDAAKTLPVFAKEHLQDAFQLTFVLADPKHPNSFPGIAALDEADVALIFVRRRTPPVEQLAHLRKFVADGKPVVGVRTASHAFALRDGKQPPAGHAAWPEFDAQVFGGNYHGHYANHRGDAPATQVWAAPDAKAHPVMIGLPAEEFAARSWLYKVLPLGENTKVLMLGRVGDQKPYEPVAWTNTHVGGGRAFYTSLGHPDDFKLPAFQELLRNGVYWAAGLDAPVEEYGLAPEAALKRFEVADDLRLEQVLTEPVVRQPVFMNFDERGRLWVVQYLQYPDPAGVKILSRDNYWRVVYDGVPAAPPNHPRGRDKITVHEDTDGDGRFDKHKTFLDGLNICTAVERGRGGVWVLHPPYLLFYPDRNNDDVPDGPPEVHLSGFGLEDTHSVVNSLRWGPDGWLYAAQGSTVTASVVRPGMDDKPRFSQGQLIWRYHPETRRYEIFAEGGGNAFGCEIDAKGRVFSGHNGGDTRGFHYKQGSYSQKGFQKHGPLSNPYAFGYFKPMKHHSVPRFTHNVVIYEGGTLPQRYRGELLGVEPLQGQVVLADIESVGSTFRTKDLFRPLKTPDPSFRPVGIKVGPDGAVYVADFYEKHIAHLRHHEGKIDRATGRIYRLQARDAKPLAPFDLSQKSSLELVETLRHSNKWFRQTVLRLLGDRRDGSIIPRLRELVANEKGQFALECLWALNLSGGLDEATALKTLEHADPYVRLWTVRLLCDKRQVSPLVARALAEMAAREPNVEARSQLACSARRLPAKDCLPIVRGLLGHEEDAADPHIPLLLWWAIESKCADDADALLAMFDDKELWDEPLVSQHILKRLMRRFAQAGARSDLLVCARLFDLAREYGHTDLLMQGFETALKGRSLAGLPSELVAALARAGGGSLALRVRQGSADAAREAMEVLTDETAPLERRRKLARTLGEIAPREAMPALLEVVRESDDAALLKTALAALGSYEDPSIADAVVERYEKLPTGVRGAAETLLAGRAAWARKLLEAIDAGKIAAENVSIEAVEKIRLLPDAKIAALAEKHWSGQIASAAQLQRKIERRAKLLRSGHGDPYAGKKLFNQTCAKCHTLFTEGGKVGPDLTSYKRDDIENMLVHIINPSAEIREGYENHIAITGDGRVVTGLLVDQDPRVVILRGPEGQNIVLRRNQLDELATQRRSLMPDGLLKDLTDQQIRDLFAYLRSTQPLNN
jgi:putative membrane-bound dehydrogenase-like protein